QNGADRRAEHTHPGRHPGRIHQPLVRPHGRIPLQREPAPDGDQAGGIKGVDHQDDDRNVEEGKAEGQDDRIEAGGLHRYLTFCCWFWKIMIGMTSTSSRSTATADASGQSRLPKNSVQSVLPIINVSAPPRRSGMTNSPVIGMKQIIAPAMTPGIESGNVIFQKAFSGGQPRSFAASSNVGSIFSRVA